MKMSHVGMGIDMEDWVAFSGHLTATLDEFAVPHAERRDVIGFVDTLKNDIIDSSDSKMAS